MLVRGSWRWVFVCVVWSAVGGCFSVRSASAGQIGCAPSDVVISNDSVGWGARTWTATCNGRDYSCSAVSTGKDSSQVACSPMGGSGGDALPVSTHRNPPVAPTRGVGSAEVKRGYDEGTGAPYVRGIFGLTERLTLYVTGAPDVAPGVVSFRVKGRAYEPVRQCQALTLVLNARPQSSELNTSKPDPARADIESRFNVDVLQPLASQFPELAVRICNGTYPMTALQISELQKLLVIYSEMSREAQQRPAETAPATAPGQTTL